MGSIDDLSVLDGYWNKVKNYWNFRKLKKKQKKTNKQREKEKKIGIKLKTVKISQTMLKLGIIVLQSISHPSEFCFTISSYCTKLNLLE